MACSFAPSVIMPFTRHDRMVKVVYVGFRKYAQGFLKFFIRKKIHSISSELSPEGKDLPVVQLDLTNRKIAPRSTPRTVKLSTTLFT